MSLLGGHPAGLELLLLPGHDAADLLQRQADLHGHVGAGPEVGEGNTGDD